MSTASVLEDTLARAEAGRLTHTLLPAGFDIDTAADLALLAGAARAAPPARARARSPSSIATRSGRSAAARSSGGVQSQIEKRGAMPSFSIFV